jgi:Rieske Fe-S protein
MDKTRRDFCVHTCQASNVPSLTTVNGTVGAGGVLVNVDSGSPLASVGGAAFVQSSAGNFLVAHTAQDTFSALTAICTHEGCTITGYESSTYTCPCHGSQFSTSGGVLRGPAGRSLQTFATSFASGTLTIRT